MRRNYVIGLAVVCLVAICLALAAYGCRKDVRTVTSKELDELKFHWQEPKISSWFYMGSKEGYHYFAHHDLPHDRYYRVPEASLKWQSVVPLTWDRAKWVQLAWGLQDPSWPTDTNFSRSPPEL